MFRWLIISAVLTVLLVLLGLWIVKDPGYVLIAYAGFTIETSIWVGLFLLFLAFVFAYVAVRLWGMCRRAFRTLKQSRNQRKKENLLKESVTSFSTEGQKGLVRHQAQFDRLPEKRRGDLLSHIQEAEIHQANNEFKLRDEVLEDAIRRFPRMEDEIVIKQLALDCSRGYSERRLDKLEELISRLPKHPGVQSLYFQACSKWGLYSNLKDVIPQLRKRGIVNSEELDQAEIEIYRQDVDSGAVSTITELKKKLPKRLRDHQGIVIHFVQHLRASGDQAQALRVLEQEIGRTWNRSFVELYGMFHVDIERQLQTAKKWLSNHSDDSALLLTLARLSSRNNELEAAREYYEMLVRVNPSRDVHIELAEVCLHLGQKDLYESHHKRSEQLLLSEALNSSVMAAD